MNYPPGTLFNIPTMETIATLNIAERIVPPLKVKYILCILDMIQYYEESGIATLYLVHNYQNYLKYECWYITVDNLSKLTPINFDRRLESFVRRTHGT